METVSIGEVIRRRREEWGVSQEMVCEGLCTSMTLSRFESGQQTPSRDCVVTMLQRLGLPDDSYYAQLTKEELRQITLRKEILACSSMYVRTTREERKLFRADALKKIKELECIAKKDDVVSRQFLVARKANWIEKSDEYSRNEIMDMLLGAIRLTVPQFDLDEINRCLYSENEISLIIDIAVQYSRSGQRRKAEDILRQLIKMLQKRYPNHIRLPLAAYNYAIYLCLERRYEESLEIVELGRTTAIKQKHYLSLPGFLHIEAECRYFMGEVGTSEKLYRSAYHIYKAIDDLDNLKILVREAKERLNLTF